MVQRVQAIFDNGILRPTTPLTLHQNERVSVLVETLGHPQPLSAPPDPSAVSEVPSLPARDKPKSVADITTDPLFARTPEAREAARQALLKSFETMSFNSGGRKFTREELHERD